MVSKMFCIARVIVLASLALSSVAWATCSKSLNGTYGFLGGGTDSKGQPASYLGQATFEPTNKFTGMETLSQDGGVVSDIAISGTYAVASNCTATGTVTVGGKTQNLYFVVTSAGLRLVNGPTGATQAAFIVAQGSSTCTNAGIKGSFGFETTGVFLAGAPATGPVAFVGELTFSVNSSGDGVISGQLAGSKDGTIFTFAQTPVTSGSYSVNANCTGTATITPEGESALHYNFVIVNGGKELLAIEIDDHTVVSGTLQR